MSHRFAGMFIISGFVITITDRSRCAHGYFDAFPGINGLTAIIFLFITCGPGTVTINSAKLMDLTEQHEPNHEPTAILTFALSVVAICMGFYINHFRPISYPVA
jgi:hypothetical protein